MILPAASERMTKIILWSFRAWNLSFIWSKYVKSLDWEFISITLKKIVTKLLYHIFQYFLYKGNTEKVWFYHQLQKELRRVETYFVEFLIYLFPPAPCSPPPPSSHLWIWSPNNRIYWWLHFTDTPDPLLALEQQNRAPSLFLKSITQSTVYRREVYFKCRLLKLKLMQCGAGVILYFRKVITTCLCGC
jgi:hypothetical protein